MDWFGNLINSAGYKAFMRKITIFAGIVAIIGLVFILLNNDSTKTILYASVLTLAVVGLFKLVELIYKIRH